MKNEPIRKRIVSIDVLRGAIMLLLVFDAARLFDAIDWTFRLSPSIQTLNFRLFRHHPWHGLNAWDVVQPLFMFVAGISLALSVYVRTKKGASFGELLKHMAVRSFLLGLFGVILHCIYAGEPRWELWNVLVQFAFTLPMAFFLMRLGVKRMLITSVLIVLFSDLLFRFWPVAGFDQPFTRGQNFGSWVDLVVMGKTHSGGWVFINWLPTSLHTIWGAAVGMLIVDREGLSMRRVKLIALTGIGAVIVGFGLDFVGIAPIIKRIGTSSFVLATGGWCLLAFVALHLIFDQLKVPRLGFLFQVLGSNPIVIYLFIESIGRGWLNPSLEKIAFPMLKGVGVPAASNILLLSVGASLVSVMLSLWMYRNRLFVRI